MLGLERVMRIELTYEAWEASVLPLNYTRGTDTLSVHRPICKALQPEGPRVLGTGTVPTVLPKGAKWV